MILLQTFIDFIGDIINDSFIFSRVSPAVRIDPPRCLPESLGEDGKGHWARLSLLRRPIGHGGPHGVPMSALGGTQGAAWLVYGEAAIRFTYVLLNVGRPNVRHFLSRSPPTLVRKITRQITVVINYRSRHGRQKLHRRIFLWINVADKIDA